MARVAVVGSGYVGLCTAAVFADLGNEVIGIDIDPNKVAKLQAGICPIFEPGLQELLTRNMMAQRLAFTNEYLQAIPTVDFVFICVNTPPGPYGGADMRFVRQAARSIARALAPNRRTIVVNKSTMPIGSGDMVATLLGEEVISPAQYSVVSNPEFLREGSAVGDMLHPDRIVLGSANRTAAEAVAELYRSFSAPTLITDLRTAEMIKYASNAFLATRISFINEVAQVCEALGANVREVAAGMGLDKRIGPHFLDAGIGFGGSCFPKDVHALGFMAEEANCHPQLLHAVLNINRDARRRFVHRAQRLLGTLEGTIIAVWGLAFKPDTDDMREAPSLEIIRDLQARGAVIKAYDPAASETARPLLPNVTFCNDAYEAAARADAVALLTEWNEFKVLDFQRIRAEMRRPIILDGRNVYDAEKMSRLGFRYSSVGMPEQPSTTSSPLSPQWQVPSRTEPSICPADHLSNPSSGVLRSGSCSQSQR